MLNILLTIPNAIFKLLFGHLIRNNIRVGKLYLSYAKFLATNGINPPLAVHSWVQERGWANIEMGGKYLDLEDYLACDDSTDRLFEEVLPLLDKDAVILEIGCSVGRNLDYLYKKGYRNLTGIELSAKAIGMMDEYFPEMSRTTKKIIGNAAKVIKGLDSKSFDLVFCHSVLVNISPEHNYIFKEMARICRAYILTLESEGTITACPRDFQRMFERHDFKMILYKFLIRDAEDRKSHYPKRVRDEDIFKNMTLRMFAEKI